jgi:hypothetical protein
MQVGTRVYYRDNGPLDMGTIQSWSEEENGWVVRWDDNSIGGDDSDVFHEGQLVVAEDD